MNKKIVIFFWVSVLSLSLFFYHHQSVKREFRFSQEYKRQIKVEINDERWDFSWKDQILYFIVIFIIFSFLITVIAKKYNDYRFDLDKKETVTAKFLTRLYYKNVYPFKMEPAVENNSLEMYKLLNGAGGKRNLFGAQRCFIFEYIIYFQLFYNFLFFFLDLLIFPMIRAFFRKKRKESLIACIEHIIGNKFYLSEDGLELICMFYICPMVAYILYRFLAFLVIRICFVFEQLLATKMAELADEEGKKILFETEEHQYRIKIEKLKQAKQQDKEKSVSQPL